MHEFLPHLDVLPVAQRRLWPELLVVPKEFVLYGGTAVALHLGHRHSIVAAREIDLERLPNMVSTCYVVTVRAWPAWHLRNSGEFRAIPAAGRDISRTLTIRVNIRFPGHEIQYA